MRNLSNVASPTLHMGHRTSNARPNVQMWTSMKQNRCTSFTEWPDNPRHGHQRRVQEMWSILTLISPVMLCHTSTVAGWPIFGPQNLKTRMLPNIEVLADHKEAQLYTVLESWGLGPNLMGFDLPKGALPGPANNALTITWNCSAILWALLHCQ